MECIFCEFINKEKKLHQIYNRNPEEYPLIPVFDSKEVLCFLSIPDNYNETHLLVIPKEHYEFIEQVPTNIANKLMETIALSCKILKKSYPACNVLLNQGREAEQYVPHVHFHIIPRNKDKKVAWLSLNSEKFKELSEELKKEFKKAEE
jgi:diadenosine tetraphosphate (Ap4A) HIT family hydrolase